MVVSLTSQVFLTASLDSGGDDQSLRAGAQTVLRYFQNTNIHMQCLISCTRCHKPTTWSSASTPTQIFGLLGLLFIDIGLERPRRTVPGLSISPLGGTHSHRARIFAIKYCCALLPAARKDEWQAGSDAFAWSRTPFGARSAAPSFAVGGLAGRVTLQRQPGSVTTRLSLPAKFCLVFLI